MKKLIILLVVFTISATGILAQSTKTPKINKKQKKQIVKINQGIKSGELTNREAKRLLKQEKKLQKHKKIAKSDGVVTKKERAKLNREANRLNAKIYKQKHDKQKRK